MNWSNFFLSWIPIIAYVLIGRWMGTAARKAWIITQNCRVQGRIHAELEGTLPRSFYLFFPYTAATRRIRVCFAEYMIDRDKGLNELSGDDLTYVRAHMLLWPIHVLAILVMATPAIWVAIRSKQEPYQRIARLKKRRNKLHSRINLLKLQLNEANHELDDLMIKPHSHRPQAFTTHPTRDAKSAPVVPIMQSQRPARTTPVERRPAPPDKKFLN